MKGMSKFLFFLLLVFAVASCDEDIVVVGDETTFEVVDGFANVLTPNIAFVAGTADYNIRVLVVRVGNDISSLRITKSFVDAGTGLSSNEAVLGTFDVSTTDASTVVDENISYSDLRDGLTVGGNPLPVAETDLKIGSKWTLTIEPLKADGSTADVNLVSSTITVSVLSPYAGNYKVIESDYWRINVQNALADFTGETRFIGSVNDTTYLHTEYIGPLGPATGFAPLDFIFFLNADNSIDIPDEVDGETQPNWGTYFITCESDPSLMDNVPCATSNKLIPDAVGGKHKISLTYGYFTVGSGEREFYELLEKVVD